jgi:mRNA interferase RelE/StbE
MQHPNIIRWTPTAKEHLARLPQKVRTGLIAKADELISIPDPTKVHKPLTDELEGCYRITYSRYRAIFTVRQKQAAKGAVEVEIIILFVAAGVRKEGDKNDVYRLATRLMKLGLLQPPDE